MSGGRLTTHVLDVSCGRPAQGMRVELRRLTEEGDWELLKSAETNDDGRLEEPLLEGDSMQAGRYELLFLAGAYFRRGGTGGDASYPFLEEVPVRFGIEDPQAHYHVPLLAAPGGYSTYRGS
ncbi:hydroxyisourate hydrolase [Paenibacillus caseinilyticus]|uniref:5-hydroxyisourate hydrolase n=1 Tax=Paenibacillus mucilaginosus K02 TaxID=997761 RepID=I0BJM2_9BACL|nr:hydroxyisourate hydrolase [Paenibacillus mucilaginosus]AFH62569.1 5-hydroxyisourate hydrolase [Paenibacillus mucilaginosus K02]